MRVLLCFWILESRSAGKSRSVEIEGIEDEFKQINEQANKNFNDIYTKIESTTTTTSKQLEMTATSEQNVSPKKTTTTSIENKESKLFLIV